MSLRRFMDKNMKKGGRFVPARLQAALALLERLRDFPVLALGAHLASKGSSGLESHETFGHRVHSRLGIEPINKNHGRRSSNLQDWGQELLDLLQAEGFDAAKPVGREALIDGAQSTIAQPLRAILEQEPLTARLSGRSAEAVIRDLLKQADLKGKTGDVAQYLIGAKLMLRFDIEIPVYPANKGDRLSRADLAPRHGDFVFEGVVIEVAMGLPDDKHVMQVVEIIQNTDYEVWLLTRDERVAIWKAELAKAEGYDSRRVVVSSVELFVGQNVTELGGFSAKRKQEQLRALCALYNSRWVAQVGTSGIRIETK